MPSLKEKKPEVRPRDSTGIRALHFLLAQGSLLSTWALAMDLKKPWALSLTIIEAFPNKLSWLLCSCFSPLPPTFSVPAMLTCPDTAVFK